MLCIIILSTNTRDLLDNHFFIIVFFIETLGVQRDPQSASFYQATSSLNVPALTDKNMNTPPADSNTNISLASNEKNNFDCKSFYFFINSNYSKNIIYIH